VVLVNKFLFGFSPLQEGFLYSCCSIFEWWFRVASSIDFGWVKGRFFGLFVLFCLMLSVSVHSLDGLDDVDLPASGGAYPTYDLLESNESDSDGVGEAESEQDELVEASDEGEDDEGEDSDCDGDCKAISSKAAEVITLSKPFERPSHTAPAAETTSQTTSASLTFSKTVMPMGYRATTNPVVYANNNITIIGTIRNLDTSSKNFNINVQIRRAGDDSTVATVYNGATTLDAAGGSDDSKTLAEIAGSTLMWNTGTNNGEFYVWMQVSPTGDTVFTVDTKLNRFVIAYTYTANFSSCYTDKLEYAQGETVYLTGNCTIVNNGNQNITGFLLLQIHKYDSDNRQWNLGIGFPIDLASPAAISVGVGQSYDVIAQAGAVSWEVSNDTEAATYRLVVAIADSLGNIYVQKVGANNVDTMENSLPTVLVEKFIDPTIFNPGSNTTNVTLRVRTSGHSLRDAGVFATGSEAGEQLKTPLDITFVVDTSGSMGDDWDSLVGVMENIITRLSVDADIRHDIFGLYGYYSPYTTYEIDGVTYNIKVLGSAYMNGTNVFTDDFEGALKWSFYKNWSVGEDQSRSSTHSACSIYNPEGERILDDDAESGSGNWDLLRWSLSTAQSSSPSTSYYSTFTDPMTHLSDDAESGAGQWTLEGFEVVDNDSNSPTHSFYCGFASGRQEYFRDSCNDFSRWDDQRWEVTGADYNSASNSFLCNYTPDNTTFEDDAEGSLKWNLSCFHLNNTVYNSSNTSFHSTYVTPTVLFYDDFENGTSYWVLTNFAENDTVYNSENHSVKAGNVSAQNATMVLSQAVSLVGAQGARLSFYVNHTDMYSLYVYISTNGGTNWTQVTSYTGYSTIYGNSYGWDQYTYDLSAYVGQEILVKFVLNDTYYWYSYDNTLFIDDVLIDTFKYANYMTMLEQVNYTNNTYPTLYFNMKCNASSSSNKLRLQKSMDGVNWHYYDVDSWYGSYDCDGTWQQQSVSLVNHMDYPYLRFMVSFSSPNQYFFIDDIWINYSTPCILTLTNPAPLDHTAKAIMKLNLSMKQNASGYNYLRIYRSEDGNNWYTLGSGLYTYPSYAWQDKQSSQIYSSYKYLQLWYLPQEPGDHVFVDDIIVTYAPECSMTYSSTLDLSNTQGRVLEYYTKYVNTGSNPLYVEYTNDGTTWSSYASLYGSVANFTNKTHAPSASVQKIRYRFTPLSEGDFVYVDDINLSSKQTNNMTSNSIDITNLTKLRLAFAAKYSTTATVTVYAKFDSGSWTSVGTFTGSTASWDGVGVDLTSYLGSATSMQLRFSWAPNAGSEYVYVDDIYLETTGQNNMTLIVPIDLTDADQHTRLKFGTLYNTWGDVDVYVSSDSGSSWTQIYTYTGSSGGQWEDITDNLNSYIGTSILLRFTHKPLWIQDYVCVDDIEVEEGAISKSFGSEWWGDGTEYLSEEYGWRSDAVKVIFPIADECAHGNTCDASDTQAVLDAIEACQNGSIAVYPIHGSWGYSDPDVIAAIQALMNQLASACGGSTATAENTTALEEAIVASLASELKIAGNQITIIDGVKNNSGVQPDWSSFAVDGSSVSVPAGKKQVVDENTINVTFDRTYIGALNSLTADPPEEVVITYQVTLPNLLPGDKRVINDGGIFWYLEPLQDRQINGTFSGGYVEVNPGADLIILFDAGRHTDLGQAGINSLYQDLLALAGNHSGIIYNLTTFRTDWQTNSNAGNSAFQNVYAGATITNAGKTGWANGYALAVRRLVHSLVIQSGARYVLLVGSDNVIPLQRIVPAPANHENDYGYIPGNVMWADLPYADINGDTWPDFAVSRLIGTPALMEESLENAQTQYVRNSSLIASCSLGLAQTQAVGTTFENNWGFGAANTHKYYEANGQEDLADLTVGGSTFMQRLDDGHSIIYTVNHGNDYRDGAAMHDFSDHGLRCVAGPCCCELPVGAGGTCWIAAVCGAKPNLESPFEPYKTFLTAGTVPALGGRPFYATIACHGGVAYADDTSATNMPMAFLDNGATGYVGSTVYTPFAGLDFFAPFWDRLKEKNTTGRALMLAKRSMLAANNDARHQVVSQAMQLYGVPTYEVYVPNDPPGDVDYNLTTNISGNTTSINVYVNAVNISNVSVPAINDSVENRTLFSINGAELYMRDGEPVVPVIVETVELPSTINVSEVLNATTAVLETYTNVQLPLANLTSLTESDGGYSGATTGLADLHPSVTVDYEVIEDANGTQTLVLRIYPIRYNESSQTVYLYRNITFGYVQEEVLVPLAELDVTTDLSASQVSIQLRNKGSVDVENAEVTVTLPENLTASTVSGNGTYNAQSDTVYWNIPRIGTSGLESIELLYANFAVSANGTYTVNVSVSYNGQGLNGTYSFEESSSTSLSETADTSFETDLSLGWNLVSIPMTVS